MSMSTEWNYELYMSQNQFNGDSIMVITVNSLQNLTETKFYKTSWIRFSPAKDHKVCFVVRLTSHTRRSTYVTCSLNNCNSETSGIKYTIRLNGENKCSIIGGNESMYFDTKDESQIVFKCTIHGIATKGPPGNWIKNMLDDDSSFDFTLTFPDSTDTIKCHRVMLTSASEVFKSMLTKDFKEKETGQLEIKPFSYNCVKLFIEFMYYFHVDIPNVEAGIELSSIAHLYQMVQLVDFVEEFLIENVTKDNVVAIFLGSKMFHSKDLRTQCLKLFGANNRQNVGGWNESVLNAADWVEMFDSNYVTKS